MSSVLDDAVTLFEFLRYSEEKSIKEALAIHSRCFVAHPSTGELERTQVPYILEATCQVCGVTLDELVGPRRTPRIANARMAAAFRLSATGMSNSEVGEALNLTKEGARVAISKAGERTELLALVDAIAAQVARNLPAPAERAPVIWPRRASR